MSVVVVAVVVVVVGFVVVVVLRVVCRLVVVVVVEIADDESQLSAARYVVGMIRANSSSAKNTYADTCERLPPSAFLPVLEDPEELSTESILRPHSKQNLTPDFKTVPQVGH